MNEDHEQGPIDDGDDVEGHLRLTEDQLESRRDAGGGALRGGEGHRADRN